MAPRGQKEWRNTGKAARKVVPRASWGAWSAAPDRRDPVEILIEQGKSRVQDLVPLRYARMLVSPFTFYRGAAAVMAADLGALPDTGLTCQLAGDAHLANFGGYASPERDFVFDVNDFDETLAGPFEWDMKRLAASFAVSGRSRGFTTDERRKIILQVGSSYRQAMQTFAGQTRMDVWYARLDSATIIDRFGGSVDKATRERFRGVLAKAQRKTSSRAMKRMTETVDGHLRLKSDPPLLVPVEELLPDDQADQFTRISGEAFRHYRRTLHADIRHLFSGYELRGVAHKVVGVGSVGTRCWVALFNVEGDDKDPLVLQLKEAQASVLEPYSGRSRLRTHGQRVVEGQRLMQAASDIFLGWTSVAGIDGVQRDYYVRQLWDWKESADLAVMERPNFGIYAQICGWTLARAHARSGRRNAIAAYLGEGDDVDRALADFAEAYADQNELDHAALQKAASDGRITVAPDPQM